MATQIHKQSFFCRLEVQWVCLIIYNVDELHSATQIHRQSFFYILEVPYNNFETLAWFPCLFTLKLPLQVQSRQKNKHISLPYSKWTYL